MYFASGNVPPFLTTAATATMYVVFVLVLYAWLHGESNKQEMHEQIFKQQVDIALF